MTAISLEHPSKFIPGGRIRSSQERMLTTEAGFEPGYPLFGITVFDPLWVVHAISDPGQEAPRLGVMALLAGGPPWQTCPVWVRVEVIRRDWEGTFGHTRFTYIGGRVDKDDNDAYWLVERRKVYNYVVHILVTDLNVGYLQLVPINRSYKLQPPMCEGLAWATSLPPLSQ